jgi:hypothetical protein
MCVFSPVPTLCDAQCGCLKPSPTLSEVYNQFRQLPKIRELEVPDVAVDCAEQALKLLQLCQELSDEIDILSREVQSARASRSS